MFYLVIVNVLLILTRHEFTYEVVIIPVFTIFVIAIFYRFSLSLVYKIIVNDNEIKIELEKKSINIKWCDISHIYVGRARWTGPTTMKIKLSNPNIKLPRTTFQLYVGAGSREGKKLLAKLLKNIENYTALRCNKIIQKDVKKWESLNNQL